MNILKQYKERRKQLLKTMLESEGYTTQTLAKFALQQGLTYKKIIQYLEELGIEAIQELTIIS